MNCRRVEKLIPLYVEGDLASGIADRIASHLDQCGRCNWLADEFKESQNWLRSSDPPEFDEALVGDLKRSVLKRVQETNTRRSLVANIVERWSRRQVLALSAAALIVIGILASYLYRARVRDTTAITGIATHTDEVTLGGDKTMRPATKEAPGADSSATQHPRRRYSNLRAQPAHSRSTGRTTLQPFVTQAGSVLVQEIKASPRINGESVDMLRIEIQTADPNIRIIWFAPKEVEAHQSNTATD